MPDENSEFADLMARLRAGDQDAAWRLIEDYGPHIRRVVRRELHQKMRSKFDSIDFVQAVWASFFREPGQMREMQTPEELLALLMTVARNKVIDETRRRLYLQKMNVHREEPLDEQPPEKLEKMHSPQPRPSQVAVAREQWQRLMQGASPEHRQILEMRFAGATYEQIGSKLDLHERSVRRIVEQMLERLEED